MFKSRALRRSVSNLLCSFNFICDSLVSCQIGVEYEHLKCRMYLRVSYDHVILFELAGVVKISHR